MTETEVATRSHLAAVVAGLALALLLTGLIAVVFIADDESPNYGAPQIGRVQQACRRWAGAYQGDGPSNSWCSSMAGWMNSRTGRDGQGQTWGSMMWEDPDSMFRTCQQWVTTNSTGNAAWCGQMVDWMNEHMGNWDEWMGGHMMGNP